MGFIRFVFVLVGVSTFGHASEVSQYWTGNVCAALMVGTREADSNVMSYEEATARFRTTLKPFAPDIREPISEWSFGGNEEKPPLFTLRFTKETPATATIKFQSVLPPDNSARLAMAQRAYGIEHDINKGDETNFRYGYAIEGREKILAHLDRIDSILSAGHQEIEEYLAEKLPFYRGGNVFMATMASATAFNFFHRYNIIDPILFYTLVSGEFGYYGSKILGRRRRTHIEGYREHLQFIRGVLGRETIKPDARAYFGKNLDLAPELVDALKDAVGDDQEIREGVFQQTKLDRGAWYEHMVWNIMKSRTAMFALPRGPYKDAALDDMFFVNPDNGQPVYIFSSRFFNERPLYPKKPKENHEYFREYEWQGAGA